MRTLLFLISFIAVSAIAADDPIRSFPIPTLEALGKELHMRDQMAALAFDALFEAHPEAKERPIKGWITEATEDLHRVYFVQEQDESRYTLAYIATFQETATPSIEDKKGAELPKFVADRFAARRAAIEAITNFWTERYNFEVLDAPDGKGFLVYGLASTTDPDKVVVGGHYRVSVSAEGKVQQVDALSRSFLVVPRQSPEIPKGAEVVGLSVSHIVSSTPVETHVYVSLLHQMVISVITPDKKMWNVSEGKITPLKAKE